MKEDVRRDKKKNT